MPEVSERFRELRLPWVVSAMVFPASGALLDGAVPFATPEITPGEVILRDPQHVAHVQKIPFTGQVWLATIDELVAGFRASCEAALAGRVEDVPTFDNLFDYSDQLFREAGVTSLQVWDKDLAERLKAE